MVNSKKAFWQALLFTIFVFFIGLAIGFYLENSRSGFIETNIIQSEISLLDVQVRNRASNDLSVSCEVAKKSLFDFADKIFIEASQLEEFDSSSKLTNDLDVLHKRYDLLRTLLWLESIELKKRCEFHTFVYLYEYNVESIQQRAEQSTLSRVLRDLKNEHAGDVLLIPIAVNMNLSSVDLIVDDYGLKDFPVIVVDEKYFADSKTTLDELENLAFERNK